MGVFTRPVIEIEIEIGIEISLRLRSTFQSCFNLGLRITSDYNNLLLRQRPGKIPISNHNDNIKNSDFILIKNFTNYSKKYLIILVRWHLNAG